MEMLLAQKDKHEQGIGDVAGKNLALRSNDQ
jgi:hypothetical protein